LALVLVLEEYGFVKFSLVNVYDFTILYFYYLNVIEGPGGSRLAFRLPNSRCTVASAACQTVCQSPDGDVNL
jgi:hypothetical protein